MSDTIFWEFTIKCSPLTPDLQEALDGPTDAWGIKVERVEIKDVKLPHQLQRAMAAEAEATREARAKVRGLSEKASVSETDLAQICHRPTPESAGTWGIR